MANRRKPTYTLLSKILIVAAIIASVYMLWFAGRQIYNDIKARQQVTEVQSQLQKVQNENDYLNSEKEKLQDPDYVENYARGQYLLSKDGEQIFRLPEDDRK